MKEATEWRPLPSFSGYEIAANGNVRSVHTGVILPAQLNHNHRLFVNLTRSGETHRRMVNLLVFAAYPELPRVYK